MNVGELFEVLTPEEKRLLAGRAGINPIYLYQIASGKRRPSPPLAVRLVAAEPRLALSALRPDVWPVDTAAS